MESLDLSFASAGQLSQRVGCVFSRGFAGGLRSTIGVRCVWAIAIFSLQTFLLTGCRTLRERGTSQHLVQARQLSLRGTDAYQRQRFQDAELLFSEALKQSQVDERAHWGYACALWQRGEKPQAIEHMEQAVKLSGSNPEYVVRLGEMYLELGEFTKARVQAEAVLAVHRRHAAAWALLGDAHRSEKKWDTAKECYHRALFIQSDYPQVQLALAEVYRNVGDPRGSLRTLDRMVDLHDTASTDPTVLLHRGLALADLNLHDQAAEALVKASERLPKDRIDQQLQIVHAQHRIGELVAARLTLGKVRESHAENGEVQRLQSMLDMSFAHLNDPFKPLQESGWDTLPPADLLADPSVLRQPTYLAQPVTTDGNWMRR